MLYIMSIVLMFQDMFFDHYGILAESFETSVPWARVTTLCRNVKNVTAKICKGNVDFCYNR
jgi:alkyldihydroxyacetonephosphate synthase